MHRLSWFVRAGDAFPKIVLLRGATADGETQRTDLQTSATTGRWFDGRGDSLAVVSHRDDVRATATEFGCVVEVDGAQDLVFQSHHATKYERDGISFEGTAGLVR